MKHESDQANRVYQLAYQSVYCPVFQSHIVTWNKAHGIGEDGLNKVHSHLRGDHSWTSTEVAAWFTEWRNVQDGVDRGDVPRLSLVGRRLAVLSVISGALISAAIIVGAGFLWNEFWLILLFSAALGFGVGAAFAWPYLSAHHRPAPLVTLLALVTGLAAYPLVRVASWVFFETDPHLGFFSFWMRSRPTVSASRCDSAKGCP